MCLLVKYPVVSEAANKAKYCVALWAPVNLQRVKFKSGGKDLSKGLWQTYLGNTCVAAGWISENWVVMIISPLCSQLGRREELFLDEESTRVWSACNICQFRICLISLNEQYHWSRASPANPDWSGSVHALIFSGWIVCAFDHIDCFCLLGAAKHRMTFFSRWLKDKGFILCV